MGYVETYIKYMRHIETDHTDWKYLQKNGYISWWPSMRHTCSDKNPGNQIKWQGNYEWGTGEVWPLYLDLNAVYGENPLKHCDLKYA